MGLVRTQFTLAAIWLTAVVIYAAIAGQLTPRLVLALSAVASAQTLLSIGICKKILSHSVAEWPGVDAVASVLSWLLLSLLVLLAAFFSIAISIGVALLLSLWFMTISDSRPVARAESRRWALGTALAAAFGALLALYSAYPALTAAGIGYSAYDDAVWIDAPFHASYVSALSQALLGNEYVDIHGRGLPLQPYHFAGYAIAAFVKTLGAGEALPLTQIFTAWSGIWLSIALYALAACFTSRPLVAAGSAALVLALPDLGLFSVGHPAFGFHWLLQVASASSAGLSCALVSCALMVHACRQRSASLVILAWLVALAVVAVKAQLFVVIAVPLFVYPALAVAGLRPVMRVLLVLAALFLVAIVTRLASESAALPLIRLDFSSSFDWLRAVAPMAHPWQREVLLAASNMSALPATFVTLVANSYFSYALWATVAVAACVLFPPQRTPKICTPLLLLVGAYLLVMVGLAADNRNATGGPLEIQLQGQVWGYACFALAAALLTLERIYARWRRRAIAAGVALALVAFVWVLPLNRALQRVAPIPTASFNSAPNPNDIRTLREGTLPSCDTLFIADGDRYMIWQAALELPVWVSDYALNPKHRPEVAARLVDWQSRNIDIEDWFRLRGITLYVLPASASVQMHDVPQRAPLIANTTFRAWRIRPSHPCLDRQHEI